jgi:Tfp pilus assembly PilM family ATPase
MTRTISIDCDPREARIAVGTSGITGVSIEHVLSTPIELAPGEDYLESKRTIDAIQLLLKQANVRSGNVIVCIGRSNVELRSVHLPSVDKNELPEMVRFAAQRHFANVGDTWPIDFVTLGTTAEGMTEVLAASMNPSRIERISKLLEANGLKLGQLVLRPMVASAVAIQKRPELAKAPTLFIDLLAEEADMAIVDGKHVVFMRTIRFDSSQDEASRAKTLTNEIKRTLLSAASQSSTLNVKQAFIWGAATTNKSLCEALTHSLEMPVASLDPFDLVDASPKAKLEAAGEQGRYAAVIGSLLAPNYSEHLIDFCNPRKRVEKKRPIVKVALAGTAAAAVLGFGFYSYYSRHAELDTEISLLEKAIKDNEESVKLANVKNSQWKKVEGFMSADFNWLDELDYLSKKSLPADKAIYSSFIFSMDPRTNNASIATRYETPEQEIAPKLQNALRDAVHAVTGKGISPNNDKSSRFPWSQDLTVNMERKAVDDPRQWKQVPVVEPQVDENSVDGAQVAVDLGKTEAATALKVAPQKTDSPVPSVSVEKSNTGEKPAEVPTTQPSQDKPTADSNSTSESSKAGA